MNKGRKSILNAVSALLQMVTTGVMALILNRTILMAFGSVYNGINATVTQIINTIMILEGGFTLASNVSLFEPWGKKDLFRINGILSATKKRFLSVGTIALVIGLAISFLYPLVTKVEMPYYMVVGLMLTVLIPISFNLAVTTKYRVLLLTDQKEYIISFLSTVTYIIGNITAILAIRRFHVSLLAARAIIMVSLMANYLLIGLYCKRKYRTVDFNSSPRFEDIKGTTDVIVMKLMSAAYTSAPIIFISLIPEKGFILASVYAVYNSIMNVVNGGLNAIVNAPRLSFGALFAEKDELAVRKFYIQYELICNIGLSVILGTTALVIMPFISVYTQGVQDANYQDKLIAILLLSKSFVEISHIPSGQMIQMAGYFNTSRKIQMIACVVLIAGLLLGLIFGSIYAVICAVLVAAIVLAVLEIIYTEKNIIRRGWKTYFKITLPSVGICAMCCFIGTSTILHCANYYEFIGLGLLSVVGLALTSFTINYVINKDHFRNVIGFILRILKKGRK